MVTLQLSSIITTSNIDCCMTTNEQHCTAGWANKNAPVTFLSPVVQNETGFVTILVFSVISFIGIHGPNTKMERRGRMVRELDSQPEGRGFESRRRHGVVSVR
jgi:hypothetical protein